MKIKKWDPTANNNAGAWVQDYPEVTVSSIVATGTPGSSTFLRGDGTWATPADSTTLTGLGITATATELNYVDGVTSAIQSQLNEKTPLDHIRSLGAPSFTNGTSPNIFTGNLVAEMEADGAFDSYTSTFKTSWSYAGNYNLVDAGRFTETAGTSWITWTDNSNDVTRGNITALAIAPNTGGSAGGVYIYNDQGGDYNPGWREVWTSMTDGAGSGLDADLLDGIDSGSFLRSDTSDTISATAAGPILTVSKTGSSPGNATAMLVYNQYGNHSWGIASEFRNGNASGSDRPSILFSSEHNTNTWSIGYGYTDDNFRIKQDHGYRNGGWGTTRFSLNRSGAGYLGDLTNRIFADDYHPNADTWTTARTITIGSTGKSVNGSGNVSWSLAEIGAQAAGSYAAASHTHAISDVTNLQTTLDAKIPLTQKGAANGVAPLNSSGQVPLTNLPSFITGASKGFNLIATIGGSVTLNSLVTTLQNLSISSGEDYPNFYGSLWVASSSVTLTWTDQTSVGPNYTYHLLSPGDEGDETSPVTLEAGDMVVFTKYTDAGGDGDDFEFTFSIINNSDPRFANYLALSGGTMTGTLTNARTNTNPALDITGHAGASNYNFILRGFNDTGAKAIHFVNGSTRTGDGGANTYTIRNDGGNLRLGNSGTSTILEGNIGIGTASPARLLTLTTSSNDDGIQIRRNSGTTNDYASLSFRISGVEAADPQASIRAIRTNAVNSGDTDLSFVLEGTGGDLEKMRITSGGNVGIGTSSPGRKLHLVGDAEIDGSVYLNDTNTRLHEGTLDSLRVQTSTGYIDIGSMNASWAHIQTDRARFYFDKPVSINGNLQDYSTGSTYWHAGNDGSGSGLDADLLDGQHASAFASSSHTHNYAGSNSAGGVANDAYAVNGSGYGVSELTWYQTDGNWQSWTNGWASHIISNHGDGSTYYNQTIIMPFWEAPRYMRKEGGTNKGPYKFWTEENDGSGSTLDADLLDGQHGSYYQPASTAITTSNIGSQSVSYANNAGTLDSIDSSQFVRSDAADTFTGNLTTGADNHITFGPNSSWGSSLRVGGNGRTATGTEMASVVTTDGNLHLDAANSTNGIYLNYYAGTGGTIFGNGASGIVARMDSAGNLYKATTAGNITATYWNSGNLSFTLVGTTLTITAS